MNEAAASVNRVFFDLSSTLIDETEADRQVYSLYGGGPVSGLDRAFWVNWIPRLRNDFETTRDAGMENGIVHLLLTKEEYLADLHNRRGEEG